MIYEWKPQAIPFKHLDPQVAGEALEALRGRAGAITPAAVVDEARPTDAPLHPAFEWDDSLAAEQFRREQAKHLIRSIVSKDAGPEQGRPIRAFVSVFVGTDDDDDGGESTPVYTSIGTALSDPVLRQQLLERALAELRQWQERYRDLEELAEVFAAAERVAVA